MYESGFLFEIETDDTFLTQNPLKCEETNILIETLTVVLTF